jgi:hypothetical protein
MMENPLPHIIILGCGRSGTSIFGELFEHLIPYTYYSEPSFDELLRLDFTKPVAVKVPKESRNYLPTPGLSFPLEILLAEIPNPKTFYWQVRHPLDAICSLRVGISNNWGHHPRPSDWREWLERPLIERCAHHWDYLNSVGYEQVRSLVTVKYFEEMIRESRKFSDTICGEVGLDIVEHEHSLAEWANRVQNTNNEHFIEARTSRNYSRSDHRTRIDRWKENLDPDEVESIIPIVEKTAIQFGYHLSREHNRGETGYDRLWHH